VERRRLDDAATSAQRARVRVVNEALVIETLTLISAAALSIALLNRIGLPGVLGYLFAGIVVGPLGFGLVAASAGARFRACGGTGAVTSAPGA
jgi:hypothetical protein